MARMRIGEILVKAGVLDKGGLRAALDEQRRWGGQLGPILVDMKLVTEEALVRALSHQLNFPTIDLDNTEIAPEVLALVSSELAERHSFVPFHVERKFLDVAMSDPTNLSIIDELRIRTQLNVRSYLAGPKMIQRALARCYGVGVETWGQALREAQEPVASPSGLHKIQPPPEELARRERDVEIRALQQRISELEALVSRDEEVLRKILGLLISKGIATRDEIIEELS